MTVTATTRRAGPYPGNAAATSFPFTFKVFASSDIQVLIANADGTAFTGVLGSDYSVTINADQTVSPGGSVTYPLVGSPLPVGSTLTIGGALPYNQPLGLPGGGNFNPVAIENQLDRTTIQIQQIAEAQTRSFTFPLNEGAIPAFPPVAQRANRLLGFDAEGQFAGVLPTAGDATTLALDFLNTALPGKGDALVAVKRTAPGTTASTVHDFNEKREFDVAIDFGVTSASTMAATKTALQAAITAAGALPGGGVVRVPAYLNYGFNVTSRSTWPSFAGITAPVTVYDHSKGDSYAGFPTAYDGAQERVWMFTPQTTSLGQHDGNTRNLRGAWAPVYVVSNDMDLSGARLASDNRRAGYATKTNGYATWQMGQGTLDSATLTDEELGNFNIIKFAAPGDTLGQYIPYLVERKTGRIAYGIGTNAPSAAHHFAPVNLSETLAVALFQGWGATAQIDVQSSAGSGSRAFFANVSGNLQLGTQQGGVGIKMRQADRWTEYGAGTNFTYHHNFQDSRASQYIHFVNNTNTSNGFVSRLQSGSAQAASWFFLEGSANAGADQRFVIAGTGNITNANNSYGAISDVKLKRDIVDAGSSWDDFKQYRFRKYRFTADPLGPLQLGVVAQEIEQVSPGLVEESPDYRDVTKVRRVTRQRDSGLVDSNGKPIVSTYEEDEEYLDREPTGEITKQVKYSVLYAKACVVIQELMARVEALEARPQ